MTNELVAGLPSDLLEACIDQLREGKKIELINVDDLTELARYFADEDVMTMMTTTNHVTTITPINLNHPNV